MSRRLVLGFLFASFLVDVHANCKIDAGSKIIFKFEDAVRLQIFKTKDKYETLEIKACHLNGLNLNNYCKSDSEIKLIVHGFMERWNMKNRWDWITVLRNEFFDSKEANNLCVIVVDWEKLAQGGTIPNYWKAISNMKIAGELVATVLNNSNIDIKKTHCIGFSLGVHMCSMMLKIYYDKYNIKVGRLTGLDPAGPFFRDKKDNERISITDADLVDVIHTSSDFGLYENCGHLNFYTNTELSKVDMCEDTRKRGKDNNEKESDTQVVLYEDDLGNSTSGYENVDYKDLDLGKILNSTITKRSFKNLFKSFTDLPKRVFISSHQFFGCSHLMAVRFFIFSINYCDYKGEICEKTRKNCKPSLEFRNSYPRMGYYADKTDEIIRSDLNSFYVNTTFKLPFCRDIHPNMVDKVKNYNSKYTSRASSNNQHYWLLSVKFLVLFLNLYICF